MKPTRMAHRHGGWTVDTIAENAMPSLKTGFVTIGNSREIHPGLPLE